MLPLPYNTDAPLYHMPIATGGLIVLNVVLFFAVPAELYTPRSRMAVFVEQEQNRDAPKLAANGLDDEIKAPDWANEEKPWKQGEFDAEGKPEPKPIFLESDLEYPSGTLALQHGAFKPWQWFTAMFLHYDIIQLIFNMVALWAFGLVVEGKVGSLIFVALYIAMGACQAGIEQVLTIFSSSGTASIGSSAALLATLGIAVIWAPRNDFDCFWAMGFRFGTIEIPILAYGFMLMAVQVLYGVLLSYFSPSMLLQLFGLPIGCAVGYVWLQSKWVDCEGWDIINVWKGNEGNIEQHEDMDREAHELVRSTFRSAHHRADAQSQQTAGSEASFETAPNWSAPVPMGRSPDESQLAGLFGSPNSTTTTTPPLVESVTEVMRLIEKNHFAAAALMYQRVCKVDPQRLPQNKLDRLMRGVLAEKQFEMSVPLMTEHIKRFVENRLSIQLNLAKVLLHLKRPNKAVAVLRSIERAALEETQKSQFQNLAAHAKKQLDDGIVELQ